jgi:hypothetical protein
MATLSLAEAQAMVAVLGMTLHVQAWGTILGYRALRNEVLATHPSPFQANTTLLCTITVMLAAGFSLRDLRCTHTIQEAKAHSSKCKI